MRVDREDCREPQRGADFMNETAEGLRERLVRVALDWERMFGHAPHITAALSEFDASKLIGMSDEQYSECMTGITAVQRGHDILCDGIRYQIKANRPSGKPGSFVTLVPKAKNFDWDFLIWILYDSDRKS